jgi:hypothetical protein
MVLRQQKTQTLTSCIETAVLKTIQPSSSILWAQVRTTQIICRCKFKILHKIRYKTKKLAKARCNKDILITWHNKWSKIRRKVVLAQAIYPIIWVYNLMQMSWETRIKLNKLIMILILWEDPIGIIIILRLLRIQDNIVRINSQLNLWKILDRLLTAHRINLVWLDSIKTRHNRWNKDNKLDRKWEDKFKV